MRKRVIHTGEIKDQAIEEIVKAEEGRYRQAVIDTVDEIIEKEVELVLLSGPSGSGKTTTTYNIVDGLRQRGKRAYYLGMDNWYKTRTRKDIPRLADGEIDYESPEAIDLDLLHDDIERLLRGERVKIPTFDFKTNSMVYNGNSLKIEEDAVLVIEGIHALNDKLKVDGKTYKVFIEPADIEVDGKEITGSELRLMRRIIRDSKYRGMDPEDTIKKHKLVTDGEHKYIYPSKAKGVDKEIDSYLMYELFLYDKMNPMGYDIVRSLSGVERKESIATIPAKSILREFYY